LKRALSTIPKSKENEPFLEKQSLYLLMPNNICLSSVQASLSLGMEQLLNNMMMSFLKSSLMSYLLKGALSII